MSSQRACVGACVGVLMPDLSNKVFVHRFTSLAASASASRLVAVLDALQTYNDFTADFYATVASLSFPAGAAQLAFQFCARGTPTLAPYVQPRLLVPLNVGFAGFVQVRVRRATACLRRDEGSEGGRRAGSKCVLVCLLGLPCTLVHVRGGVYPSHVLVAPMASVGEECGLTLLPPPHYLSPRDALPWTSPCPPPCTPHSPLNSQALG